MMTGLITLLAYIVFFALLAIVGMLVLCALGLAVFAPLVALVRLFRGTL